MAEGAPEGREPRAGVAAIVAAAAAGDAGAWEALIDRYAGLVWSIARGFRLSESDAADVRQVTWMRLVEHIHRLRDPEHVGAWLATTARRECLLILSHRRRVAAVSQVYDVDVPDLTIPEPDAALIAAEDAHDVQAALSVLPPRWHQLMDLLMSEPEPSYEEVSALLDMPVGSIGPTRGRSLRRLRAVVEAGGGR